MKWTYGTEVKSIHPWVVIGDVTAYRVWDVWTPAGDGTMKLVLASLTKQEAERLCTAHNEDQTVTEDRLMQENQRLRERLEQLAIKVLTSMEAR